MGWWKNVGKNKYVRVDDSVPLADQIGAPEEGAVPDTFPTVDFEAVPGQIFTTTNTTAGGWGGTGWAPTQMVPPPAPPELPLQNILNWMPNPAPPPMPHWENVQTETAEDRCRAKHPEGVVTLSTGMVQCVVCNELY